MDLLSLKVGVQKSLLILHSFLAHGLQVLFLHQGKAFLIANGDVWHQPTFFKFVKYTLSRADVCEILIE